ncbi:lipoyl domain-containing protein [Halalkalicoccus ordinarius]|uniref:lipoyl domain-containing protein n=1 Tax=Halalkalicoccus ordinarius TaxID=3116651 RepID=UPI00300EB73B
MSENTDRVAIAADGDWTADVDAEEGVVVNWFVGEGSAVEEGDSLCEIQVEKVSVDMEAPTDGTLDEIAHDEGDEFTIGDTLAWIEPG